MDGDWDIGTVAMTRVAFAGLSIICRSITRECGREL